MDDGHKAVIVYTVMHSDCAPGNARTSHLSMKRETLNLRTTLQALDRRSGGILGKAYGVALPAFFQASGKLIPDKGVRHYCPCCDTKLLTWKQANFSRRPNLFDVRRYADMPQDVVCPICHSIPRHRIIAWHLEQRPDLLQSKKILHFAPERSLSLWLGRQGLKATTADLNKPADLKLDLTDIELPDDSYDVVICNHVLEHVSNYQLALSELRRILRPGGLLIISFPVDPTYDTVYEDPSIVDSQDRIKHFGQYDHLRVFGNDSTDILRKAGFRVELARGTDCPETIRPVTGPANYDSPDIFFCWEEQEAAQNDSERNGDSAMAPTRSTYHSGSPTVLNNVSIPHDISGQKPNMRTICIIVPVFNAEDTLERCVGSILAQTYTNLDIVLVDDGSTDISGAMCDAYAYYEPRIRCFHTPNNGLSAARNLGITKALEHGAEFIAFVDADDWIEPQMIERLFSALISSEADIAQCGYRVVGFRTVKETMPSAAELNKRESLEALIRGDIATVVWNKLYRSVIFEELRFPEGRVFEDISTTHRMIALCDKVSSVSYLGYDYVMREDSIAHTHTMRNLEDYWLACRERLDYLVSVLPDLHEEERNILIQGMALAVSKMWRWGFSNGVREIAKYSDLLCKMHTFVRTDLSNADKTKWPLTLKVPLVFARSNSLASLAAGCYINKLIIAIAPNNTWSQR